ncbi:hypothetical protein F5Y11DRAFT_367370 [Daldinia sp. FL1419]|nr:hypothetical protein F5Y11DRAFT_367370 [Daldinia sp. FL1419]
MAAVVTAANESPGDPERGQVMPQGTRRVSYVRDITYKIIPCCFVSLVLMSAGAILVATLHYNKPMPQKPVIIIAIMLAVLFGLGGMGGCYLLHRKYFPPLTEGPSDPDRPPPEKKSWKDKVTRCCELIIEKLSDDKVANNTQINTDPPSTGRPALGTPAHPAEMAAQEQPSNARLRSAAEGQGPVNNEQRNVGESTRSSRPLQRRPVPPDSRYNYPQANNAVPRGSGSYRAYTPSPDISRLSTSNSQQQPFSNEQHGDRGRGHHSRVSSLSPDPRASILSAGRTPYPPVHAYTTSSNRQIPQGPRTPPRREPSRLGSRVHFAYVCDDICPQKFPEALHKELSQGGLYIFGNLPILAPYDPAAVKHEKQSQRHKNKSSKRNRDPSVPRSPIMRPTSSEYIVSPLTTPSSSPKQTPSLCKPVAQELNMPTITSKNERNADDEAHPPLSANRSAKPTLDVPSSPGLPKTLSKTKPPSPKPADSSNGKEQRCRSTYAIDERHDNLEELGWALQQFLKAHALGKPARGRTMERRRRDSCGTWAGYSDHSDQRHSSTSARSRSMGFSSTSPTTISECDFRRSSDC